MNRKLDDILMTVGGIVLLVGAMLYITGWPVATYLYCFGAIVFAAGQITDRYSGDNVIIRRLRGQQVLGALFLLISGLLMYSARFRPDLLMNQDMNVKFKSVLVSLTAPNSWIVFMCISAIFELYSSFRISHETEKEDHVNDSNT